MTEERHHPGGFGHDQTTHGRVGAGWDPRIGKIRRDWIGRAPGAPIIEDGDVFLDGGLSDQSDVPYGPRVTFRPRARQLARKFGPHGPHSENLKEAGETFHHLENLEKYGEEGGDAEAEGAEAVESPEVESTEEPELEGEGPAPEGEKPAADTEGTPTPGEGPAILVLIRFADGEEAWWPEERVKLGLPKGARVIRRADEEPTETTKPKRAPAPVYAGKRSRDTLVGMSTATAGERERHDIETPPLQEQRQVDLLEYELGEWRSRDTDERFAVFEGLAAVFNQSALVVDRRGRYMERFRASAFDRDLHNQARAAGGGKARPIKFLFDHGRHPLFANFPMGRLDTVEPRSEGLYVRALMPRNWMIQPILDGIEARAIAGMSINFVADDDRWWEEAGERQREVRAARLIELGPVVDPIYLGTEAALRSLASTIAVEDPAMLGIHTGTAVGPSEDRAAATPSGPIQADDLDRFAPQAARALRRLNERQR